MDLNALYHRYQVSLMRSAVAACSSSRLAHLALAKGYAGRIDTLRATLGAAAGSYSLSAVSL